MHLQITPLRAATRVRSQREGSPSPQLAPRFEWLEVVKGVALVWIVWNHVAERLFGFPLAGNPAAGWPPLAERMAQLRPLTGHGWLDLPLNLLRWVGWAGDQGVQLFLIAGGFGLTWGLLVRDSGPRLAARAFWRRRARRIYPLWWAAHLLFVVPCLLLGRGLDPRELTFWLDLVGVRVTPYALYYFAPAWWYVGLLIQLTAVYPLLWIALRRFGPARFLAAALLISFAIRGGGLLLFHDYLDAWSRGAIFVTRLPEFAAGMALAAWMRAAPAAADAWLRARSTRLAALAAWAAGSVLSLGLLGMTVAPFLLGVGAFGLLYAPASAADRAGRVSRTWGWLGRHSYSLFLMHQPFLALCVPHGTAAAPGRVTLGLGAALAMTVVSALALERAVGPGVQWLRRMDVRRVSTRVGAAAAVVAVLLVGAELTIRHVAPREVWGWGERPSLEPDQVVGWRLRPATRTRLRWLSYDYVVRANALGFPGPNRPVERAPGMLRVLVTGDAFSSAEGVDTDAAWPRLLEQRLRDRLAGRVVEVLNFSITGYGPTQEAAVVREFAPRFQPDVIVLQSFVNDFDDTLTSDAEFRESIGFGRADPRGWLGVIGLAHLSDLVKVEVLQPLHATLTGTPPRRGYHLGSFPALERNRPELEDGRRLTAIRWREIAAVAGDLGARLVVLAVPAPGEVCTPADLAYWPHGVDLGDAARFDPTRPQRWSAEIAAAAGAEFHDLHGVLRAAPCPYQPHNMHWTADGHRRVADAVAGWLMQGGGGGS
jgi:peptidoglycan/LPS O-acetylase OafA/YrhL/lysophospholipase L1-like esterase